MKKGLKVLIIIAAVLLVCFIACAVYVSDYYRAEEAAVLISDGAHELSEDILVFEPENARAGFIFYPGGKVEYTAYEPLMNACKEQGILCVLVKMPFNLAVLDINAANGITEQFPHVENWYIGGHSLGGSMAAGFLAENLTEFDGLILLGSYSTYDLSDAGVSVLSVYGSEDTVLNREKYNEYRVNLPDDFTEIVIDGGCHAYFGVYGPQDGDGTPEISNEEQISLTAEAISAFVG